MRKIKRPMYFLIQYERSSRIGYYFINPSLDTDNKHDFGNYLDFITNHGLQARMDFLKIFAKQQKCNAVFLVDEVD